MKQVIWGIIAGSLLIINSIDIFAESDHHGQQLGGHQEKSRDYDNLQYKDKIRHHKNIKKHKQKRAYGCELMSKEEKRQHRKHLKSLKTEEERKQYRLEHHKKMQARAKEQGVNLPDSSE